MEAEEGGDDDEDEGGGGGVKLEVLPAERLMTVESEFDEESNS